MRIPRKKGSFIVNSRLQGFEPGDAERIAFGIEANYFLSHTTLLVYHLLFILPGFVFWGYWLRYNPGDYQDASVPLFAIVVLIGTVWGLFGKRIGIA